MATGIKKTGLWDGGMAFDIWMQNGLKKPGLTDCCVATGVKKNPVWQTEVWPLELLNSVWPLVGYTRGWDFISRDSWEKGANDMLTLLLFHSFGWLHWPSSSGSDQKSIFDHDRLISPQKLIFWSNHRFSILYDQSFHFPMINFSIFFFLTMIKDQFHGIKGPKPPMGPLTPWNPSFFIVNRK